MTAERILDGSDEQTECELLVARTAIQQQEIITFTRLPVGHTHEDIDAYFGRIGTQRLFLFLLGPF
jgi:hypothetical protein